MCRRWIISAPCACGRWCRRRSARCSWALTFWWRQPGWRPPRTRLSRWINLELVKILDGNTALNLMFNHGFAYWIYGGMSVLAAVFVIRYVPETKGRSLEAIQEMWGKPEAAGAALASHPNS